ncbi:MAG: ATP-binding protein, partial [Chloroflexota bacterium]|nr:ATP-binding protein [Chloroflexota bacterium]
MSHRVKRVVLPFAALVGQQDLQLALLLNAINPSLMGVLVTGEKGTGKSTAVRALADLLPEIEVVRCRFNCSPSNPSLQCNDCNDKYLQGEKLATVTRKTKVVELPLGATEDRVVGTLDIEKALSEGIKALQPGILAEVNQGILYIDEVNLLDDHLVDVLLDSAAMGVNSVERESISISHPSRFILVGTMNPEEGEIRPQLLDRFGLSVNVKGLKDPKERIEIIKLVEDFEKDPESIANKYDHEQADIRQRILNAREILNDVEIPADLFNTIINICIEFEVHGHRADFLIARAAKTIAAYNQRKVVAEEDVEKAAELVLPHRMRRLPFEEPQPVTDKVKRIVRQRKAAAPVVASESREVGGGDVGEVRIVAPESSPPRRLEKALVITERKKITVKPKKDNKQRAGSGRRTRTLSTNSGKYVRAKMPQGKTTDIAVDATIRAAAARNGDLNIKQDDIREKVRAKKVASIIMFVVDASGSMAAIKGLDLTKSTVMSLLEDSYQKRDRVGMIAVAGNKAQVVLQPTSSVQLAVKHLREIPTEGLTPLSDGLYKGF